jgi:hypothetical protein
MQRERRRDPYAWTWEIPVAVALAILFVIVFGIQLGRSVANVLAGAGWTWPDANAGAFPSPIGTAFWTSLPGVLTGHAGAGNLRGVFSATYTDSPEGGLPPLSGSDEVVLTPTP